MQAFERNSHKHKYLQLWANVIKPLRLGLLLTGTEQSKSQGALTEEKARYSWPPHRGSSFCKKVNNVFNFKSSWSKLNLPLQLMFPARAYPSGGNFKALLANIKQGWKVSTRANTLAYLFRVSVPKKFYNISTEQSRLWLPPTSRQHWLKWKVR